MKPSSNSELLACSRIKCGFLLHKNSVGRVIVFSQAGGRRPGLKYSFPYATVWIVCIGGGAGGAGGGAGGWCIVVVLFGQGVCMTMTTVMFSW